MEQVRVLQGCSILEGGLWYHQGAVLEVADPASHYRTVTDAEGKETRLPCTESAKGVEPNQPAGLTPVAPAKPQPAPETPAKSKEK